jgi:hypothetical protein
MWKCKYCNITLEYKNKFTKSGHLSKCKIFKDWKKNNITKEYLERKYIEEECSLPEIAEELELDSWSCIVNLMKKYGIKLRTLSNSRKIDKCKAKQIETRIRRTGFPHNFSKGCPSRLGWEKRLLEEEGIVNVFQRESVKKKIIETMLERYGVERLVPGKEIRQYTSIHRKVVKYLNSININCEIELVIPYNNSFLAYDIFIKPDLLIETNGDYWHCNPLLYKSTDVVTFPDLIPRTAQEIWDKDKRKIEYAENNGFKVLVIWEKDINEKWEYCETKIQEFINENIKDKIY